MKDILKYKDYIGSVNFSSEDDIFFGRIEGINSLVTFEGRSVDELKKSFAEAVDDYIEICDQTGINPMKSYKGSFNIRISPELHRKVAEKSRMLNIPINKLVQQAIEKEVV